MKNKNDILKYCAFVGFNGVTNMDRRVNVAIGNRIFYSARLYYDGSFLFGYLLNFWGNEFCFKLDWRKPVERARVLDIEFSNENEASRIEDF